MSTSAISHRRAHSELNIASGPTHSLRSYLLPPSFLRLPFLPHLTQQHPSASAPSLNPRFAPFSRRPRQEPVIDANANANGDASDESSDADSLFSVGSSAEPVAVAAHALIAELEAIIAQLVSKNAVLRRQRSLLRAAIARLVRELNVERKRRHSPASRRTPYKLPSPSANTPSTSHGSSGRTDATPTPALGDSSGGSGGSALGDLIAVLQEKSPKADSHYSLASRSSSDIEVASSSQFSRVRPSVATSTDDASRRPSVTTASSPPSVRSTSTHNSMIRITTGVKPKPRERLPTSPSSPHPISHTRTETVKAPRTVGAPTLANRPSTTTAPPLSYQKQLERELGSPPTSPTETKSTRIPVLNNFRTSARRLRDTLSRKRSVKTQPS